MKVWGIRGMGVREPRKGATEVHHMNQPLEDIAGLDERTSATGGVVDKNNSVI